MKEIGKFILYTLLLCYSLISFADSPLENLSNLIQASIFEHNANWKCTINQQQICSLQGCSPSKSTIWINLSKITSDAASYKRCNAQGCDEYTADFNKSGIYTNISIPNNATILKVTNDGSEFSEVTMAGTRAFVGFGTCIAQ